MNILKKICLSNDRLEKLYIEFHNKCNLKCKYCHLNKDNINYEEALNSWRVLFSNILQYIKKDNINIILFGGEPLYDFNYFKKFILLLKECNIYNKKISIDIINNGTFFLNYSSKELYDILNKNNIEINIMLSFDGIYTNEINRGININDVKKILNEINKYFSFKIKMTSYINEIRNGIFFKNLISIYELIKKFNLKSYLISNDFVFYKSNSFDLNNEITYKVNDGNLFLKGIIDIYNHYYFKENDYRFKENFLDNYIKKKLYKNFFNGISCINSNSRNMSFDMYGNIKICRTFFFNYDEVLGRNKKFFIGNYLKNKLYNENIIDKKYKDIMNVNFCNGCQVQHLCPGICPYLIKDVKNPALNSNQCYFKKDIFSNLYKYENDIEKIKYILLKN